MFTFVYNVYFTDTQTHALITVKASGTDSAKAQISAMLNPEVAYMFNLVQAY